MSDFAPTAPLDNLRQRAVLLKRLRNFFDQRDFLEVETPLLSADTVVDRHLDPLPVTLFDDPREMTVGRRMWLQTSPEFAMKRLLAAGATAIYQVTRAFRMGERGAWHNPEFTMVEWYRVGDDLHAGMDLLADFAAHFLPGDPPRRLTYREAFLRHIDVDPLVASPEQLAQAAWQKGLSVPESLPVSDRDSWLDLLMAECVQPHLGHNGPTILHDYPVSQAALARVRPDDPSVAERFELFSRGIELANGYCELQDPAVLRERNREANRLRAEDGRTTLPEDSRLLEAMESGLPLCSGVALGFDRLVMLSLGVSDIAQVMAFPSERA